MLISRFKIFIGIIAFVISAFESTSQSTNETEATSLYFSNVSAGFGMLYGGLGGNFEIGVRHFSGFGAFGYAPKTTDGNAVIKPSYNFQAGLRYYLNVGSDIIFPRIGLGFGWITNYYDQRITLVKYDQNVQGLSVSTGLQVYSFEGFVFSFDLAMSSNLIITKPQTHPFFYGFYIRPCIGIGYDLTRIFGSQRSGTIKNKEINPFDT